MKTHAQVVVIGGGVVGCSVLYHLARQGWSDAVLLERSELTSGSTWHAAGGMHTINGDPNVAKLQRYTISLYPEIEELSGHSCGLHMTGGVMLAGTKERFEWLKMTHARGRYLGMETELISPGEAKSLLPLLDENCFVGALYDPVEGHADPSGVTYAYAKAARKLGGEYYVRTKVTGLSQSSDGLWLVSTTNGEIRAEHVVNAGGLWAREVGRMVGLELPILAMEHMYLLTDDMEEVRAINESTGKEVLHAVDFEGELYLRQEGGGMLMGTYERAGKPWSAVETPWDFGHELLEPDLDRIAPSLEVGFKHFPAFAKAGIRTIINGPFTFAPDGNPLVGPVRGLTNFWCASGVMAGFSQGGGVGLALANWMIDGDPGHDLWGMDIARFGDYTNLAYTNAKVRENYSRRFQIRFPNEELPAARPLQTTPLYLAMKAEGAVFGESWSLEVPLWFAGKGARAHEDVTFRRSNAHGPVGDEVAAVRTNLGLAEISSFAKYHIHGPAAQSWLSTILAGRLPKIRKLIVNPMLNHQGKLIGDFTVGRLDEENFWIFGSGIAQNYHMRWFEANRADGGVTVKPCGLSLMGLQIAGPGSRALMARIADCDMSAEAFPFLSFARMHLGSIPAMVGRISFTGDQGFELWVEPHYLYALYRLLCDHAGGGGIGHFGSRALNSMRLEKSFGSWAREYRPIYGPTAGRLDRFIDWNREGFIGRDQALKEHEDGPGRLLTVFEVDADDADVIGDEPIWHRGTVVGWVTSGGYAHHSAASVAMGYIPAELAKAEQDGFEIEIIGERRPATPIHQPLFDPAGARMRS
ncbi:MAG: FAD-dependent oxidoreductase [Pseudomonadota bacterium]